MRRQPIVILLLSAMLLAASSRPAMRYVSPEADFEFSYPAQFELQTDFEHEGATAYCATDLVCVKVDGSGQLVGFGFWVVHPVEHINPGAEAREITTQRDCLNFVGYEKPVSSTIVNGIRFAELIRRGAAAGTVGDSRLLRTFHDGKCYELGTGVAWSDTCESSDLQSGRVKPFTQADRKRVDALLESIVNSFRFLR